MARVLGPFHSLSASGSIARLLTARATARGSVVLRYSRPGSVDPSVPSAAQLAQRAAYGAAVAAWRALTQGERDQYDADAVLLRMSGWNLFLRENIGAAPGGTAWDGGATSWDGGATSWD